MSVGAGFNFADPQQRPYREQSRGREPSQLLELCTPRESSGSALRAIKKAAY
jgi:hypothetical protein